MNQLKLLKQQNTLYFYKPAIEYGRTRMKPILVILHLIAGS